MGVARKHRWELLGVALVVMPAGSLIHAIGLFCTDIPMDHGGSMRSRVPLRWVLRCLPGTVALVMSLTAV